METAFLFRKSKLSVKRKAEHIRNRQLHVGPLERRSQGTLMQLAGVVLYTREGGRERSRKPDMN